jgi:glucokinase
MTIAMIADIGGTNARFALVQQAEITTQQDYKCADFPTIIDAIRQFFSDHNITKSPEIGMFAIAGPIDGDEIDLTNMAWKFSCKDVQDKLEFTHFEVMNDFKAVALGILQVEPQHIKIIHDVPIHNKKPIGILGPGTGLGVASLIYDGRNYIAVEGEGGHVTMAARTPREFKIFEQMLSKYHHISAERVCSGKGLENLYHFICELDHVTPVDGINAEQISQQAIAKSCPVCVEVLDLMCTFLGRIAGNLAVTLKAQGGIYIAGGIPPKLGNYFMNSRFLNEFTSKGRMSDLVKSIPVFMVDHPSVGMLGLQHRAKQLLQNL